jgi:hypothetical protein
MFSRNFFSDRLSPVSLLLLHNTHGGFTLKGRKMLFTGGAKSLLFKEGILNEIQEMLDLPLLIYFILFLFIWFRKIKREGDYVGLMFFSFPFYTPPHLLFLIELGIISSAKMNECLERYIHKAGGVDMSFIDGSYVILHVIFNYKVSHITLVMKTHVSSVNRVTLIISEKVFWNVRVFMNSGI